MRVICAETPDGNGERRIYDVVPDYLWYWYEMPTGRARRVVVEIPETEPNKALCQELLRTRAHLDAQKRQKHFVDAADNVVARPGWERHRDELEAPRTRRRDQVR